MAGPVVQSYLTKNVKAPINEPKVGRESTFSSPLNQKRYSYRVTTMLLSLPERTRVSLGNKKPQLGFGETFLYRFLDSLITPPPIHSWYFPRSCVLLFSSTISFETHIIAMGDVFMHLPCQLGKYLKRFPNFNLFYNWITRNLRALSLR